MDPSGGDECMRQKQQINDAKNHAGVDVKTSDL
jgi:hypothetical protein